MNSPYGLAFSGCVLAFLTLQNGRYRELTCIR
jgi:hypothetical protein